MDCKELIRELCFISKYEKRREYNEINVGDAMAQAATAITDLLARAESAEAELKQKETYYDKMVDALAATDSFDKQKLCEEADHLKDLLKEAEARAEKAERERDAAVSDLETIMAYGEAELDTCEFCKNGQCYAMGGTKPCLPKWRGQKEE